MTHRYTTQSGANATDRITGLSLGRAIVQLSTGDCAFLVVDTAGTGVRLCSVSAAGTSVTDHGAITANIYLPAGTTAGVALCRDNLDNLYVVGWNTGRDFFTVQAWTKGAGLTWTAQTALNGSGGNSNFAGREVAAIWANTGGGTSSKGHILIEGMHTTGNPRNATFDAGIALAGAGTVQISHGGGNNLIGNGTYGAQGETMEWIPDGFGATSGVLLRAGYNNQPNVSATAWSVNSSGVVTSTGVPGLISSNIVVSWLNRKMRTVRYAADKYVVVFPQITSGTRLMAVRFSSTAVLTSETAHAAGITDWPDLASAIYWDLLLDPLTPNKVWVVARSNGNPQTIVKLGIDLTSGISWDTVITAVDTAFGAVTSMGELRTAVTTSGFTRGDMQASMTGGGATALFGGDLNFTAGAQMVMS